MTSTPHGSRSMWRAPSATSAGSTGTCTWTTRSTSPTRAYTIRSLISTIRASCRSAWTWGSARMASPMHGRCATRVPGRAIGAIEVVPGTSALGAGSRSRLQKNRARPLPDAPIFYVVDAEMPATTYSIPVRSYSSSHREACSHTSRRQRSSKGLTSPAPSSSSVKVLLPPCLV